MAASLRKKLALRRVQFLYIILLCLSDTQIVYCFTNGAFPVLHQRQFSYRPIIGTSIGTSCCRTRVRAFRGHLHRALTKFKTRPGTYLLIPCVAALVGWLTNWLAVQMIFYPTKYWGIPLYRKSEVPLGLVGWQGIIPCKTKPMSEAMVNMVTSQLLTVKEAFSRIDPRRIAKLLAPEVPKMAQEIVEDVVPSKLVGFPAAIIRGLPEVSRSIMYHFNFRFLVNLTKDMQENIDSVFDIKDCVVSQMMEDRRLLGELFRKCGQKELDFLTNSGLW